MRQPRLKASPDYPVGLYHCVSCIVHKMFLIGEEERDRFVDIVNEYAHFCGVQVLAYCVMTNHFHLLVAVPRPPEGLVGHEWLLERLDALESSPPIATKTR